MNLLQRFLLAFLTALPALFAGPVVARADAPTGPTFATEDTMYTELPEVLVSAPRVTLQEIIDRVYRGEARRESLLTDQAFTFTLRFLKDVNKKPVVMIENARRVYRKRPDKVRTVMLREYRHKKAQTDDDDEVRAEFTSSMGEEIVNFAFRPEARREYKYKIANRTILGNRVIYEIDFEPKSSFDFENPSGRVWVDTNEFVIVRQELEFQRSPAPLFLKDIPRAVIERQRVNGHWVLKRVLMRAELTIPIPGWGRHFDFALIYSDYALNSGLDDALFTGNPVTVEAAP
jgi:hypothetical protein